MSNERLPSSRYWTVSELAAFLGVPKTWVYDRTRRDGPELIPHLKFGKYIRFDPASEAFQAWLERHAVAAGHD